MTVRSFIQRVRDLIRYREATANMQERYPTATSQDLAATDSTCIVCREEMISPDSVEDITTYNIPETPKKLPCGHMFHFRCLRGWLERQQACPTWYFSINIVANLYSDLQHQRQITQITQTMHLKRKIDPETKMKYIKGTKIKPNLNKRLYPMPLRRS